MYLPSKILALLPLNIAHLVHIRLCSPLPTLLSPEIKHNPKRTPQDMQTHIHHDWRKIPAYVNPVSDELTETIPPQILVDRDIHEERTGDGFVTVDSICAGDGGKGGDLDTGTCVADDDNNLYSLLANESGF